MTRTRVECAVLPFGNGMIHDEESGDGLVVWVAEQRITAEEARQLEDDLNAMALAKGRPLTVAEVLGLVPFLV